MTDPKELTPEERANEERDARREAGDDDKGLIDTLSKSVESFTNPLVNQTPDDENFGSGAATLCTAYLRKHSPGRRRNRATARGKRRGVARVLNRPSLLIGHLGHARKSVCIAQSTMCHYVSQSVRFPVTRC